MAVAADRARFQKYADSQGRVALSTGFFQKFFVGGGDMRDVAILQCHNFRWQGKENYGARARLTDGVFTYSAVFFHESLLDQLKRDNMAADPIPEGEFAVIAVKKCSFTGDFQLSGKTPLVVEEYELLAKCSKIAQGAALPSSMEEIHNFDGYKPSPVYVPLNFGSGDVAARPPPAARAPPPPSRSGSGMMGVTPISAITPYISKWRILGQCTAKEDVRTINSSARGPLKVFNFELTDDKGGCIRVAAFGDTAEKLHTQVQTRCSYYLSGCSVRAANKKFNTTGSDYELTIRNPDELVPCLDHAVSTPQLVLRKVSLDNVAQHVGTLVDILAVVDKVNEVNEFTAKSGAECVKRDVQLIDESATIVTLTLWSQQARDFDDEAEGHAIGIKGAMVKEFNGGYSLSAGNRLEMDPEVVGVEQLLDWYTNKRQNADTKSISIAGGSGGGSTNLDRDLRFLGTASALDVGRGEEKGSYLTLKAMINGIKSETALYQACPSDGCSKKVIIEGNQYRCEKCQKTSDTFKWNYMIQAEVFDSTGYVWVTMFSKAAEQLLGMTAQQLGELKEQDPQGYEDVFQQVKFKPFVMRARAKAEVYNEEEKIRYHVFSVDAVDYDSMKTVLEETLKKLNAL